MYHHIAFLSDAISAVGGLRFYRGVPPEIIVNDVIGGRKVQSRACGLEGQNKNLVGSVILKIMHHFVPLLEGAASVIKERFFFITLGDKMFQQGAHFGKLAEY